MICTSCGARCNDRARFCDQCGTPLSETPTPAPPLRAGEGERRHLTVMFCDLVGSTSMSGVLDPEELQAVVLAFQEACTGAIEQHGGYVAHFMGDGILAYFGFPVADEQAAVHAVRAGLAVVDAVGVRARQWPELAVRVGIHRGITVVADMGAGQHRQVRDVVGETPNVAARIQSVAEPGTVLVSDEVKSACEGFVEVEPAGEHELKGVARPLTLHRAVAVTEASNRLDVAAATHRLTPLVGRERELELLRDAWQRSLAGDGQVVWISGEPGIGKSRLVRELVGEVRAAGGVDVELRCSSLYRSSSLHPSVEQLRRALARQSGEISIVAIERFADDSGTPRSLAVPVVAELLGVPLTGSYQPISGSADKVREHTLEILARLVDDRAARQPVLVVIEDLQWMDGTSLELVERYVGARQRSDVMTVVTHRSDHVPEIPRAAHHVQLTVDRLEPEHIGEIIRAVAGDAVLRPDVEAQVSARTEGIPLFAEELSYLLAENEGSDVIAQVPSTLRDSLMARLDVLGSEGDLLRIMAVLGREAPDGLLFDVSGLDRVTFTQHVDRLLSIGLVIRRGDGVNTVYAFKHALQQEVVYESMLRSTRREIHALVAGALEARFVESVAIEPETSARHFEKAGQLDRAIEYLLRAGDRANAISAHDEALVHLGHARELVEQLDPSPERDALEIAVLVRLGVPITATRGYGSAEAEAAYARAEALCAHVRDDAPVFAALYGLFRTRLLQADYRRAEQIGSRLSVMSSSVPHRVAWRVGAGRALGSVTLYQGHDHDRALRHFGVVLAAPDAHRPGAYLADLNDVVDPVITSRSYAAWAHWLQGRPEDARRLSEISIADARRLGHPFSLDLALSFDAWLAQFEGDVARTRDIAAEGRARATEHGFAFWIGWNMIVEGWAAAREGRSGALDDIDEGLHVWTGQGSRLGLSYFLALRAEAELLTGNLDRAYDTLVEAETMANDHDEHFWSAEILRWRAEVAQRLDAPPDEVVSLRHRAEEIARRQGAVALSARLSGA